MKDNFIYKLNLADWLNEPGHLQGVAWTILACIFSNMTDTTIRLVSGNLHAMQITFFRLLIGTLIVFPVLLYQGKKTFIIKNKRLHFVRIIIGFCAIACWVYGAGITTLPSITTISFTCPIFVLFFAYIFLGEKSCWKRITSVAVGFIGVIIIAYFEKGGALQNINFFFLHPGVMFLIFGAILFAMSDILNKKMVCSENILSLLFYFYLGTAIISFIPALYFWKAVNSQELFYLFLHGLGGALILYCILKAANATEISSIAPYKYMELIFSIVVAYIIFKEIVSASTVIGASLIIPSAFFIAYYEIKKNRNISQGVKVVS